MGILRRKWSKLNRPKKLDQTKEAFLSYQKEVFYEPTIILDHQLQDTPLSLASSREECPGSPPPVIEGTKVLHH